VRTEEKLPILSIPGSMSLYKPLLFGCNKVCHEHSFWLIINVQSGSLLGFPCLSHLCHHAGSRGSAGVLAFAPAPGRGGAAAYSHPAGVPKAGKIMKLVGSMSSEHLPIPPAAALAPAGAAPLRRNTGADRGQRVSAFSTVAAPALAPGLSAAVGQQGARAAPGLAPGPSQAALAPAPVPTLVRSSFASLGNVFV